MRQTYHLKNLDRFKGSSLLVERSGGRLAAQVSGPGSKRLAPFVKNYFDWLNRTGPLAELQEAGVYSLYLPPIPSPAHARMLDGFLRTWLTKQVFPQTMTFAVTYDCQCRCVHCSAPRPNPENNLLSLEEIKGVISQGLDLGVMDVYFTGGEPLLRPDLEECIAWVSPSLAVTHVFSNGQALDAKRAAALKEAGLYAIVFSLDSPDPAEHDRLRGCRGAFAGVKKAVRAAQEAGLVVGLSAYATNDFVNQGRLQGLMDLAQDWGVPELTVLDVIPTGRLLHRDDMLLTQQNRQRLMADGRAVFKKYRGKPRIITQTWTNGLAWFAKSYGCLAGSYEFHVSAYGDFTPCDFTPISFGNVRKDPVKELWQRLLSHPAYCRRQQECRMQSPQFRRKYIHPIPAGAGLPYPMESIGNSFGRTTPKTL
ncbi:MAG: radical SAM protein [Desulfarculaceae bacterium]